MTEVTSSLGSEGAGRVAWTPACWQSGGDVATAPGLGLPALKYPASDIIALNMGLVRLACGRVPQGVEA